MKSSFYSPVCLLQLIIIYYVLKTNYQDWDAYVFTGNLEAAKNIGLKTSRRIPLYNGSIDSRLLKYELYRGSKKEKGER